MSPFVFDTLDASKRLREAGMAEGVAEAVVAVFQHATASTDFSQLATKADIANMATKADIADMATKADIADMAFKADLAALRAEMATKSDLLVFRAEMKAELASLDAKLGEKMRTHSYALGGLMISLVVGASAILRFAP